MTLEIQAGLQKALERDDMWELIQRYQPRFHEAIDAAEVLRQRIANGKRTIAEAKAGKLQGLTPADINDAEVRLAGLELELRTHDYWLTAGLGLVMAWAFGTLWSKAAAEEGWATPPGTVLRLIVPGLVNVAMDLT